MARKRSNLAVAADVADPAAMLRLADQVGALVAGFRGVFRVLQTPPPCCAWRTRWAAGGRICVMTHQGVTGVPTPLPGSPGILSSPLAGGAEAMPTRLKRNRPTWPHAWTAIKGMR